MERREARLRKAAVSRPAPAPVQLQDVPTLGTGDIMVMTSILDDIVIGGGGGVGGGPGNGGGVYAP